MLVCNSFGISTCKMCDLTASYGYIAIVFALIDITVSGGQQWECKNNALLSNNNLNWKCVEEAKCGLANTIPAGRKFQCGVNKICCPEPYLPRSNTSKPIRHALPSVITRPSQVQIDKANLIASHKCYEYKNYIWHNHTEPSPIYGGLPYEMHDLDCITSTEYIYVGLYAVEKQYPHMALLGYDENVKEPENWRCSGSLISEQFILSAAHCTEIGKTMQVKWALLGKLDKWNISLNLKDKNLFRIVQRINHPHYKVGSLAKYENNDIALYKLEKPIKLSSSIRPICLYHKNQTTTPVGASVVISGWGLRNTSDTRNETLKKVSIDIVDKQKCIEQFKTDPGLQDGFDPTTMICAGDSNYKKDWSCPRDPGGPLQVSLWTMDCMYLQLGVESRGPWDCRPAIYTKVAYYLPWIQSVVWPTKWSSE